MKRSEIIISASLVPLDYLMIIISGILAYSLRYWQPITSIRPVIFNLSFENFLNYLWLIALLWLVCFALAGLYSMQSTRRTIDEISKIILGCSTAVMILMFLFFFSRNLFDSRFIILAGWFFSIILVIIGRGAVRIFQKFLYYYGIGSHRIIIIGAGAVAEEIKSSFQQDVRSGYKVVEEFSDFSAGVEKQLIRLIQADKFDEILVANANLAPESLERLNDFSYLNHIAIKYVADIFEFPISNFDITTIANLPVIEVKKTRLDGWGRIYKRIFDWLVSAILIILLSPVFLIIALVIKLDSRGPLFFSYQRIGEHGRPFKYFKFRSMIKDAHQYRFDEKFLTEHQNLRHDTPMMKFQDDPRVTKVGRFIRHFSLDELPELFNVLIGKMSLVGPRPHEIEEVAKYGNFHRRILTIKPGMTGMAQVSGRSDLNFDEEVRLDVWYMENWSLKLDLMILFKTPLAVLKKRKTE